MSGTVTPASIMNDWESAENCDEFIRPFRGRNMDRFIFFHPGFNLTGGHRRAVYLVENGLDSFIFYCEKPEEGRKPRRKRVLKFLTDIDNVVVYAGYKRMTGERWFYSDKSEPLTSVQLMFIEGKPLQLLVPSNRVDIPFGYSTDLSQFMERILKKILFSYIPQELQPITGTGKGYPSPVTQEQRIKLAEKKLKEMQKEEQELVESEPTNEQVAKFYLTERSQELPRGTSQAPYSYYQAFRRGIPRGKRLTGYPNVSGASQAISRTTQRIRNMNQPFLGEQQLDLPVGGKRTRRGRKRRHPANYSRRRARSKRR